MTVPESPSSVSTVPASRQPTNDAYALPAIDDAWTIDAADFPVGSPPRAALLFAAHYATLAPSPHNTQPWTFRTEGEQLVLGLDMARGLAVVDPYDREGLISVGAALQLLCVALEYFGFLPEIQRWPAPKDPAAVAAVSLRPGVAPSPRTVAWFDAITKRRTSHSGFIAEVPPEPVMRDIVDAGSYADSTLVVVDDSASRRAIGSLVARADRMQRHDPRFRRELASWLRRADSRRRDGIHGFDADHADVLTSVPLLVRSFDVGGHAAHLDYELVTHSPVMAVLCSARDSRDDWVSTGMALGRVLLAATAADISVGYLNQVIEVASTRAELAERLGLTGSPQLLLRLGYGGATLPQPRRQLGAMIRAGDGR